ncbi:hypothetical protein GAY28_02170 [Azospirillum brasilense]|nr:hypothetical protein [Azospirillum brasilense]
MARTRNLFTMERVAEMLGEDFDWLMDIAIELEPEDGCLTVFGPGEQWFYALTEGGIENLKDLIHIHRTGS